MTEFAWSQTAANNTTSDPNINWQEGMAPSLVNDSARAMMAALAKKRDDDAGLLITGGIATAFTLTTNQNLAAVTSPANVDGFAVNFQPHLTNGAAATLSVDGQTARALQSASGTALPAGFFIPNAIYRATYKVAATAWIVHGVFETAKISTSTVASGGTANAQTVAAIDFALVTGAIVIFNPGNTNTAAMTLAVNGTTAKSVLKQTPGGLVALTGGEIVSGVQAMVYYDGTQYQLMDDAAAGFGALTSLASATTTDLGTIASHVVNITGTTTITGFGSSANANRPIYFLTFAGALTLTNNATSLILPGGQNIATAAGDTAIAEYLGSGNWRVLAYFVAAALPGKNPTVQTFTSGTAQTYTPGVGSVRFRIRMGAGGAGGGGATANSGTVGGNTTFLGSAGGFVQWTCVGGTGGAPSGGAGGAGGTGGADGTGTKIVRFSGGDGAGANQALSGAQVGGQGGVSAFGGAGPARNQSAPGAGVAAKANTGSGGGGAISGSNASAGGGAGEYVEFWLTAAQMGATATYTVGASGGGGAAGGNAGGNGAAGIIIIEEFYS